MRFKKGSKEAKLYMAKIRNKKKYRIRFENINFFFI